jgi:hypothetical protein
MFPWFISPWEAARLSFEAQRVMMSLPWLFFASGRRQEGRWDGQKAPFLAPPLSATPTATPRPNAIPARQAVESIKAPVKARREKDKRSRRKGKMRKR